MFRKEHVMVSTVSYLRYKSFFLVANVTVPLEIVEFRQGICLMFNPTACEENIAYLHDLLILFLNINSYNVLKHCLSDYLMYLCWHK